MPPKRPAPLSDKALVKGDADAAAADAAPGAQRELPELGETNAGLQMTVKNTFIDVPSGLSPTSSGGKPAPLMTAPAQVHAAQGFIQRRLESAGGNGESAGAGAAPAPAPGASPATPLPQTPATVMPATPEGAPLRLGWPFPAGVSDRQAAGLATAGLPGHAQVGQGQGAGVGALPSTPLVTPSPSSNSLFSAARYQLFGGPAPLQPLHEVPLSSQAPAASAAPPLAAAPSSLAPVGPPPPPPQAPAPALPAVPTPVTPLGAASPAPGAPLAAEGPAAGHQLTTTLRSGPFSYGSSTIAGAAAPAPAVQATLPPPPAAEAPSAAADAAGAATVAPGAGRADRGDDDSDDDSDEGGQKMPQVGVTGARTAEEAPKPPPGAKHPSLGSENHEEATCKRCCFFPRNRCLNGYQCEFCHYEHEKRKRKNKKSKKKNKDSADAAAAGGSGAAAAGGVVDPSLAAIGAAAAGTAPMVGNPWLAGPQDLGMQGAPSAAEMQMWEAAAHQQLIQQQQDLAGYGLAAATTIQQGFAHLGSNQLVTYQWVDGLPGQQPPLPFAGAPGVPGVDPSVQQGVPSIPLMYHQVPPAPPPAHLGGYGLGVDGLAMPPPLPSYAAGSSLQPPYGATAPAESQAQASGLLVDPAWRPPFPAPQYDPAWQQAAAAAALAYPPATSAPAAAALAYPAAAGAPGAPPPLAPALPEVMQGGPPLVAPVEPPTLPPPPSHEAAVPPAPAPELGSAPPAPAAAAQEPSPGS